MLNRLPHCLMATTNTMIASTMHAISVTKPYQNYPEFPLATTYKILATTQSIQRKPPKQLNKQAATV